MESVVKKDEKFAVVFKVTLLSATLNEAKEFKNYLEEAIKNSDKEIVIDLSDCEHMDSTFLGVLVSGFKSLKKKNRNLVLIEPKRQSSIFLTLDSIGKIFPIYNNVIDALQDIENKKLLELELSTLGDESERNEESSEDKSFTITEHDIEESFEEKPELQTENIDSEPETLNLEQEPVEETNIIEQETFVMEETETVEQEKDLELISDEKVTEEITSSTFDSETEIEPEIIETNPSVVEEVETFRKGKVEWKFGFEPGTP